MSRRGRKEYFDIPPIPKIIHQIWIPNWSQVPSNIKHTREAWVHLNPTWEYKFWGQREVERLLNTSFRFLKETWQSLGEHRIIKRADLARIMILQSEGGLYADMDLRPLIPMKITSQLTEKYIGCAEHTYCGGFNRLCNGFIGAPRNSKVLLKALKECVSRIDCPVLEFLGPKVISSYLLPEKTRVLPWQEVLSTQIEEGALCLNLNSRSWGEPDAGQDWYLS